MASASLIAAAVALVDLRRAGCRSDGDVDAVGTDVAQDYSPSRRPSRCFFACRGLDYPALLPVSAVRPASSCASPARRSAR